VPPSLEVLLPLSERFPRSVDWILPGEGKWLRPASGCCSPGLVTSREEGFNGNQNQPNYLSTWNPAKVEIGAEIPRAVRSFFDHQPHTLSRLDAATRPYQRPESFIVRFWLRKSV
jgi:hypothetical protein